MVTFKEQRTQFELRDHRGVGNFLRGNPSTLQTLVTVMNRTEFREKNKISKETLQRRIDYLLEWHVITSDNGKYRLN
jgi:hypothetical protein